MAIGTGILVLVNGAIVLMIYRMTYYPHPTLRSMVTIHLLRDTIAKLKAERQVLLVEKSTLENERDELRNIVYSLSQQAQQLRQSLPSES